MEDEARKAAERARWDRRYRGKNRDKCLASQRRSQLKTKYGITLEKYDEMLERQGGVCAVCGDECSSGKRLQVDHCHTTHKVRGLLCGRCNKALGLLKDNPELLTKAAAYVG